MRFPNSSYVLSFFLGCLLCFGFSFSNTVKAQVEPSGRIYAAKKDGLWGLINQKGEFFVAPHYTHSARRANSGAYFMVDSGSVTSQFTLDVYDTLGKLLGHYPDTLSLRQYGTVDFFVKGSTRPFLRFYEPEDTLIPPPWRRSTPAYYSDYNNHDHVDSTSKYRQYTEEDPYQQVFFKLRENGAMYSYIQSYSGKLFLVNSGGTTLGYYRNSRNGCVIFIGWIFKQAEEGGIKVDGGLWGVLNERGDTVIPFEVKDKTTLRFIEVGATTPEPFLLVVKGDFLTKYSNKAQSRIDFIDREGKKVLSLSGQNPEYEFSRFGCNYSLRVNYANGNAQEYILNQNAEILAQFDAIGQGFGNPMTCFPVKKEGYWHVIDCQGNYLHTKIAEENRIIHLYDSAHFYEKIQDSLILFSRLDGTTKRIIQGSYLHRIDAEHMSVRLGEKTFHIQTLQGDSLLTLFGSYRLINKDILVNDAGKPARCSSFECDLPRFENVFLLGNQAIILGENELIDSNGNLLPFYNYELFGALSGLSIMNGDYLKLNGKYIDLPQANYYFRLTPKNQFAIIGAYNYDGLNETLFWFPEAQRLVKIPNDWRITDFEEIGSVLCIHYHKANDYSGKEEMIYLDAKAKKFYDSNPRKIQLIRFHPSKIGKHVKPKEK